MAGCGLAGADRLQHRHLVLAPLEGLVAPRLERAAHDGMIESGRCAGDGHWRGGHRQVGGGGEEA
jgi:hypothetical protein